MSMVCGDEIRKARKKSGMTQVQVAAHLGVSQVTISLVESGHRLPSASLSDRLTQLFGHDITAALFDRKDRATIEKEVCEKTDMMSDTMLVLVYSYIRFLERDKDVSSAIGK